MPNLEPQIEFLVGTFSHELRLQYTSIFRISHWESREYNHKNPATFGQHFPAIRWDSARSQGTVLLTTQCRVVVISDMVLHYPLHGGLYSKTKCGFHSPAGAHTPPAPVREETNNLKENARRALQHAVEHRLRVDAAGHGQRRSMAALSRLSLLSWARLASR